MAATSVKQSFYVGMISGGNAGSKFLQYRIIYGETPTSYFYFTNVDGMVKYEYRKELYRLHLLNSSLGKEAIGYKCAAKGNNEHAQYREACSLYVVCFDISSRKSFNDVPQLIKDISKHRPRKAPKYVLVGTKKDLAYKREVTTEEAEELAKKNGMPYVEVSAKENINIDLLLNTMMELLVC